MAELPQKNPLWRRVWMRWTAVGLLFLFLIIGVFFLSHWLRLVMQTDASINANTWIGLVGSIVSSILGGLAAVLVLLLSFCYERKKHAETHRQELIERRLDLLEELGDLVGTLDLGAGASIQEVRKASLQTRRVVSKIDRLAPDRPADRHVSIALFHGARAFQEVCNAGLSEESTNWLAEKLLPAIEILTADIAHRDTAIIAADADSLLRIAAAGTTN